MSDTSQQGVLEQAARLFTVASDALSPLQGGHFAQVYEWVEGGQSRVLKIAPAGGADDLLAARSVLEWLAYLAAHGAPVVRPVRSRTGSLIEYVESAGKSYLVSASEKISGVRAESLPLDYWDAELIAQLGRVLGRSHALAQDYVPSSPALRRGEWDQADNCFNPSDQLAAADAFVLEKRAQMLQTVQALPKDGDSYGLAHLDIHFANFIVDAQQKHVTLIDFDDCAYGWFVMDVAMLLFDVLVVYDQAPDAFGGQFLDALVTGYRAEKALPDFWIAQLPAFLKLLEIGIYVMLAGDYDPATCTDDWVNKFMAGREQRIRGDVPCLD